MDTESNNFEPRITTDAVQNGIRYVSAECCEMVCSRNILMSLFPALPTREGEKPDYVINKLQFVGGCQGNTSGICQLVKGMKVKEVISRLDGIDCQCRGTSCPDQLARVLKKVVESVHTKVRETITLEELAAEVMKESHVRCATPLLQSEDIKFAETTDKEI